jgi:type IV fimbrial biogenesis protein FimT
MNRSQQRAFSLVELLVAVTLLSLVLTLAIPSFGRVLENARQQTSRDLLIAHVNQTRTLAISENRSYQLCGSVDGLTCDGGWTKYWLIVRMGREPSVIRQQPAPTKDMCWKGFSRDSIFFDPNGNSRFSNGRFARCSTAGENWQLILSRQGRLKKASTDALAECC